MIMYAQMAEKSNVIKELRQSLEYQQLLGLEHLRVKGSQKTAETPSKQSASSPALQDIRNELGDCKRCPLHEGRQNIVFGDGNPNADLMFIGEAPGRDEDMQGLPFVGRAGKLL